LIWAPLAQKDVRSLFTYFETVASPDVASTIYSDIMRAADLIKERPQIGRPREDIKRGYRSIRTKPFLIYYRFDDREVRILRILHERRDIRKVLREK
jgi:toxin ParE1/3/4